MERMEEMGCYLAATLLSSEESFFQPVCQQGGFWDLEAKDTEYKNAQPGCPRQTKLQ